MATTIKVSNETKNGLNLFREYENETYDEVLRKLMYIANTCKVKPKLSQKATLAIDEARERIKKGQFLTENEAKKKLGL